MVSTRASSVATVKYVPGGQGFLRRSRNAPHTAGSGASEESWRVLAASGLPGRANSAHRGGTGSTPAAHRISAQLRDRFDEAGIDLVRCAEVAHARSRREETCVTNLLTVER